MNNGEPIDVETVRRTAENSQAVVVRHQQEVGAALSASQITERLRFIKQVMQENMIVGVDYGKVPGCGDKPGLFQPGAQKLSMTFQLNPEVRREEITDYANYHRGYRLTVRVSNGNKFADGVGECSTLESKYRYRNAGRKCPKCGKASIIKGKAEYGGGWVCFTKKEGCGAKFVESSELGQQIASQGEGKVENDNPPDHWNTVRKMAFKRGFVHAIINATNTSELWSQDLEDLASNGVHGHEDSDPSAKSASVHGASQNNTRVASEPPIGKAANTARTEADAKARTVSPAGGCATAMHRDRMIAVLIAWEDQRAILEYARKAAVLLPTETLPDWPLQYVPVDAAQMKLLQAAIKDFMDGGDAVKPFVNPLPEPEKSATPKKNYNVGGPAPGLQPEPAGEGEPWRAYVLPFGKDRSPLGQMSKKTLFGWWANFRCEPTYEKDGKVHTKSPASLAKDKEIRKLLDEAGRHYEFTTKEAA